MKVQIEKGVWLAGCPAVCQGDPCRTLKEENAYQFANMKQAKQALEEARVFRPFKKAVICEDFI